MTSTNFNLFPISLTYHHSSVMVLHSLLAKACLNNTSQMYNYNP